jgi:tetratricopeptide (TPR) repeat protein
MNQKNAKISGDSDIVIDINSSLDKLKTGDFENALVSFENILRNQYSNSIAESGIKCCKYWIPRLSKFSKLKDNFEKGKSIYYEWIKFESFICSLKNIHKKVINNIMYFIFNFALRSFKNEKEHNKIYDYNTLFMIAVTYKKIGDYYNAIKYFEESLAFEKNNPNCIAELADCYALIDEIKKAKVLFREAFYIDPLSIDINLLESEMIQSIILKIEKLRINNSEIKYWIPIFGRVFDFFNVVRKLMPIELGKLEQEIFYLKKKYNEEKKDVKIITRLLNCLLFLYDNLKLKEKNIKQLDLILLDIKNVSENVFNLLLKIDI